MTLLRWQIAENKCALGTLLALAPKPSVVIGPNIFHRFVCPLLPHQKQVAFSSGDFPFLCVLCNEPSGCLDEGSK